MKIVVTGSLGRIGKPLTEELLQKGYSVTVISSKAEKQNEIEALGAIAAIGSILDANFLAATFKGADIVYLMEPPFNYFDQSMETKSYWGNFADSYVQAIEQSGVTKVVHLSSIGAHTDEGVGILDTHHFIENILKQLPENVLIKTMRPVGFYYNMFAFIPSIKKTGTIIQNYGGDEKEPWVSPLDIASVIAEEIEKPFNGRTIRYIASDEVSPNEVAKILGGAIGKLDLKWVEIPDEQFQKNLINIGFNPSAAKGLTEMNASRRYKLYEDYNQNKPILGEIKVSDFAKDFAAAYRNSN